MLDPTKKFAKYYLIPIKNRSETRTRGVMLKRRNSIVQCIFYLIFIILVIDPVFAGEDVAVGDGGNGLMEIGSQQATEFSISASSGISDWVLLYSSEANTCPFELHVSANGNWKVTAEDLRTTTDGHMTEWDGSDYGSERLINPMMVSATSSGYIEKVDEVELPVGGIIAIGTDTSNEIIDLPVTFKQPVSWADNVLENGHSYNIVVTFTISAYIPT